MQPNSLPHPQPAITLAGGTIHNPDEPRHFMKVKPIGKTVQIKRNGRILAISNRALRVIEVGRDLYDPPLYIPEEDIWPALTVSQTKTRCPLKGEAQHYNLPGGDMGLPAADIAWSYPTPNPFASVLRGYVAFYADQVTIEETPC